LETAGIATRTVLRGATLHFTNHLFRGKNKKAFCVMKRIEL
jgi:hypothetical protein